MHPTGVGSGEATQLVTLHTAGDTSQSTLRKFSVVSAVSSSTLGFFLSDGRREPNAKKKEPEYRRAGEVPSVLSAGEILAQNNPNNTHATTCIPATGEPRSITFVGETLCANLSMELFLKRRKLKELSSGKSKSFVIWKMNFKSEFKNC